MRVGLTGGVASGKSSVSAILRELGAVVVDADVLAREVVAPGTPGLAAVVEAFGVEVLAPDGSLDRSAMAALVFADADARRRLEAILHPLVREAAAAVDAAAGPDDVVVHDIPLLVETGQADRFDAVLVVDTPPEVQHERMIRDRGMTAEQATARIAAQAARDERLAAATYVLHNDTDLADLRRQVHEVYDRLVP